MSTAAADRRTSNTASVASPPSPPPSLPVASPKVEWVPDAHAPECSTCASAFTPLFRRHHCRQCGRVVCAPCSSHSAEVSGAEEKARAVRVCCECWCEKLMARRGLSQQRLMRLLRERAQPDNSCVVQKANLLHEMAVIEQEIAEAERRWTEMLGAMQDRYAAEDARADAERLSAGQRLVRQEQREHEEDVMREERTFKFNLIGQQAASVHDQLSALRAQDGLLLTVVKHERELRDVRPWLVRLLLVTPQHQQPHLIALSGFLYPNPAVEVSHVRTLRWHTVRTMDQLQAVRPTELKVAGSSYRAVTLVFQPSTPPEPAAAAAGGAGASAAAAVTAAGGAVAAGVAGVAAALRKSGNEDELTLLITDGTSRSGLDALHNFLLAGQPAENGEADAEETKASSAALPPQPQPQPQPDSVEAEKAREIESHWQWDSHTELQHTVRLHMKAQQDRTRSALRQLERSHHDMTTAVRWEDPSHAELLTSLYSLYASPSFPPFPGVRGEAWKRIGFQGDDPTTDFRGMGLLSLRCLVFMGERCQQLVRQLVDAQDTRPYPLCAAGVNVVAMICDALGLTGKELPFVATAHSIAPTPGLFSLPLFRILQRGEAAEPQLELLFCCLMQLMDAAVLRTGASYLQFGEVMKGLKDRLAEAAKEDAVGLQQLMDRLRDMERREQQQQPAVTAPSTSSGNGSSELGSSQEQSETSEESEDSDLAEEEKVRELQAALLAEEGRVKEEQAEADRRMAAAVIAHSYAAVDEGLEPMQRNEVEAAAALPG